MSMINSSYNTGNRIHDLQACSAVPQASALPRATLHKTADLIFLRVPWSRGLQSRARQVVLSTKFCSWRPMFVVSQYWIWFLSSLWRQEMWGYSWIFAEICGSLSCWPKLFNKPDLWTKMLMKVTPAEVRGWFHALGSLGTSLWRRIHLGNPSLLLIFAAWFRFLYLSVTIYCFFFIVLFNNTGSFDDCVAMVADE